MIDNIFLSFIPLNSEYHENFMHWQYLMKSFNGFKYTLAKHYDIVI